MIGIKKLDRYILQKFLLIFVGAFFICLFVFMMQFTWRYVDELIGKGLSLEILGQFFWYMGITLVPQALPLAILLASLITFGNLGETLELLAMKAAGIPLMRIMRPLGIVALIMTGTSFYFQNSTSPEAQVNLRTLLFSMKQQSPAVEIPEGVFYNGVPNINLFVEKKNAETGMLYQTIIYKTDQGFERAQIVLADSARLEMTSDKLHLKLDLWNGEQFEALQSNEGTSMISSGAEQPYDRETFQYKQLIIDFDSNFNLMDKELLSGMPSAKNMKQIEHSVDSVELELDSIGRKYYKEASMSYYKRPVLSNKDSIKFKAAISPKQKPKTFEELTESFPADKMDQAYQMARSNVLSMKSSLEWKSIVTEEGDYYIRRHWIEWHQKMTLSLACILFFFVGAPLGAIIRKGGLGLPTVISVIIFIFWYIINTSGMKMARDGSLNMVIGMWASTAIITPFAFFISYKANHDSVVFNMEAYLNFFRRLFGISTKRHIFCKEVIIDDPQLDVLPEKIKALEEECRAYHAKKQLLRAPNYVRLFFHYTPDNEVEQINQKMEAIIEELSNSKNPKILATLNKYPILFTQAHVSPFHDEKKNMAAGIFFPLGIILWFRIWHFRLHLYKDLKTIVRTCERLNAVIDGSTAETEDNEEEKEKLKTSKKHTFIKRIIKWILLIMILALLGKIVWNSWERQQHKKKIQLQEQLQKAKENENTDARFPQRQLRLPENAQQ